MHYQLAYGKKTLDIEVPDSNILDILLPGTTSVPEDLPDNAALVAEAMRHPAGSERLGDIVTAKGAQTVVIVVNDITRPTPYRWMLPPILEELEQAGILPNHIKLVVALGIHRPHTDEENMAIFGAGICQRYEILNHDCDKDLQSVGSLSNGWDLLVNQEVARADILITTGVVELHYIAGWSGGRKSILPGVASRSLIEANHKMMDDRRACLGNYHDNPVNDIMLEAAGKVGIDFILNVVTAGKDRIIYASAGDYHQAWLAAVKYSEQANLLPIKNRADVVIASCGGYPKDINVYQSQKALDAAVQAVKPGGTIIWLAECSEGLGEATFAEWVMDAGCPADIEARFHTRFQLGGHKAYAICRIARQADVIMVTDLDPDLVQAMFIGHAASFEQALEAALDKHGSDASIIMMPQAPRIAVKLG